MPYFPVDDDFNIHPKLVGIRRGAPRERAAGLWGIAGSWCAKWLTEGAISAEQIEELGCTRASAEALVAAKLWHRHGHECPLCPQPMEGGYQFHEWSAPGRNPTREQVMERRAKRAAAGAQGGKASGETRRGRSKPEALASPERSTDEASASQLVRPPYPNPESQNTMSPPYGRSPARTHAHASPRVDESPAGHEGRWGSSARPRGYDGHPRHEHHDLVRDTCRRWETERHLPVDAAELIAWCYRLGDGDAVAGRRLVDRATTQELDSATSPVRALRARLRELAPRRRDDDVPPWVQEVS